ncbi:unnamed protein product [Nippostrongylus brasiliensis]|uniref:Tannase/feruloyl esterase family alpha/beta hydrolase n=1 Tax=Nippostrongylus brasiliensis TaxID=27835 RepID=A0A158R1X3_NIPBR|nr:unnamed protein product [Nippostrongylus brasiliensis]
MTGRPTEHEECERLRRQLRCETIGDDDQFAPSVVGTATADLHDVKHACSFPTVAAGDCVLPAEFNSNTRFYEWDKWRTENKSSGYRGIPDTQTSSGDGPNYMGALTKANKAGKHTFGSYGSIDSEKAQIWQPHPTGSSGAAYGETGVIVITSVQHEELHLPL